MTNPTSSTPSKSLSSASNSAKSSGPRQPALVLCEIGETGVPGFESWSPFCLKVHRALHAAGLEYTSRHGREPGSFKDLHPTGQVPVLLVDDEPIGDSTKILARIERFAPRSLLAGLDARGRAEALLWEELADTTLAGFLVAARWADDRNWPRVRDTYFAGAPWFVRAAITPRIRARVLAGLRAREVTRAGMDACWARFEEVLDQLDARAPGTGFWLDATLTLADISLFAPLHSMRTHLTPWQAERVAARPRLSAWLNRVDVATRARALADVRAAA
jgi:glutathione S-transferase